MQRWRAFVLAALPCLLLAATVEGEEIDRNFERSFEVAEGDRLQLVHGDGDVTITPWERDTLEVRVRYHAEFRSVGFGTRPDFDVDFRRSGDTIRVVGRERGHSGIGFFSSREYEHLYTVRAPAYLRLDLDGDDGDVEIGGWRGEVSVRADDGDLSLADLRVGRLEIRLEDGDTEIDGFEGELDLSADDGDVRISDALLRGSRISLEDGDLEADRCEGSVRVRSDDGDVVLAGLRAGAVDVTTADGDIDLELLPSEGLDLSVRTDDGRVSVDLAEGVSATFSITTADGHIRLTLPGATELEEDRRRASGRVGDGRGRIRIRSGDGPVSLGQSGAGRE